MLLPEIEAHARRPVILVPTTHMDFRNKDEQNSTGEKGGNVRTKVGLRTSCIVALQILFFTVGGLPVQSDSSASRKRLSPLSPPFVGAMCTARSGTGSPRGAESAPAQVEMTAHVRAYHDHPPTGPLPATLEAANFKDNPKAFVVYSIAARIRELLYQEPCYCHCDQNEGHKSLLDCYTRTHAVRCFACQSEAIFIFQQNKMGKTATSIRAALNRGEWTKVDVDKYAEAHYAEYCKSRAKAVSPMKPNQ